MKHAVLLSIALALACAPGCKRKLDLDGRLDELVKIKDDGCACSTLECAKYQSTAFTAWNFRNDSTDNAKMTPKQHERLAKLQKQLQLCLVNVQHGRPAGSDGRDTDAPAD